MKTVMSAIQPTNEMHIGNYFGAIQNWTSLQEKYKCYFGIVDYHAITMPFYPQELKENTMNMAIDLISVGVDIRNIFIQSLIPEHTELAWILNCYTSYGELQRMTQFKDKSDSDKLRSNDNIVTCGLFTYPILQAADILIYHADYVPVGKDQEQHLQLTRSIANRFNYLHGKYFKEPQSLLTESPKILSLSNPDKKMSKSLGDNHCIKLFDDEATIRKKIKVAVTDSNNSSGIMSNGVRNLFTIIKACGELDIYKSLMFEYESGKLKYSDLKENTTIALSKLTTPFIEKRHQIKNNMKHLLDEIKYNSDGNRVIAKQTLKEVKEIIGLY